MERGATVCLDTPQASVPAGFRRAKYAIDGGFLRARRLVFSQVQVHSALLELIDPDGRCLELGRAGLGICGIDREIVGCHLIVKMER